MRVTRGLRVLIALLVVAGIAFLGWRSAQPEAMPLIFASVDRGRVERTVTNTRAGTVHACRRAKLSPSLGGQIVALPFQEGQRVREGQVLLELWSGEGAAQARVAERQARSAVLRAQEACGNTAMAQREAERARKMHKDGLLPDERLDRAVVNASALVSACEAARAEAQRSNASIELARAALTRTVLRAPFDGVVARINGEIGEITMPSPPGIPTPPVIDLIDDSCLYINAPIDEVDVAHIRVGQPATITLEALPGKRFAGRVRRVAPYVVDVERQARTVDVEVALSNPADARSLLVGNSADVQIIFEARENVLRVPTPALLEGGRVLVPDAEGILEERKLQTGISNFTFTEVLSGIGDGQKVVVSVERTGVAAGVKSVEEASPPP